MLHTPTAAAENQHEPVMAAEDQWRRGCHRDLHDELEEGEVDAGCHSETDTEEYYNRHYSPSETDETVSDCETSSVGGASASSVARGWRGTGKRSCSGSSARAVSPPSAEPEQPIAIAAAEPEIVLQPTPLAFATPNPQPSVPMASARASISGQSGSAQPKHDDAMEIAAAGATSANPPTEAVVHQEQPIAPPAAAGEQPALVHQQQPAAPPAAGVGGGRQDPNGYTCKKCGMWFVTHQGLGGHTVGHKHREIATAAAGMPPADGAAPAGRRNPKPERRHVCDQCGAEFRTGVQLGGHKRKHWTGPPIVPKKKPRVVVQPLPPPEEAAADLTLALPVKADEAPPVPPAVEAAPPAVERSPEPAPRPPAASRVLLFGIDIGAGVQAPEAQQGSPATESSASTGGQQ